MLRDEQLSISDDLHGDHAHQVFPALFPNNRSLICRHVELEDLPKKEYLTVNSRVLRGMSVVEMMNMVLTVYGMVLLLSLSGSLLLFLVAK
jgi:hypothetical protein